MEQRNQVVNFMKTRRNFSDLENNFRRRLGRMEDLEAPSGYRPKASSIKINRSRLPPDFFPRSQSVRKKVSPNKHTTSEKRNLMIETYQKPETQRGHYSPEKTSFFGFFDDPSKQKGNTINAIMNKRKFESRQQPKRDKIIIEPRHFTPLNGAQRPQILQMMLPARDLIVMETENKSKIGQISPRKEHQLKYQEAKQAQLLNPEKNQPSGEEDAHNITFFNAKSTSFPPINKNKA